MTGNEMAYKILDKMLSLSKEQLRKFVSKNATGKFSKVLADSGALDVDQVCQAIEDLDGKEARNIKGT